MANLKTFVLGLAVLKNTQQITRAMKMVSAAKLKSSGSHC